jgi:hypothetical protein
MEDGKHFLPIDLAVFVPRGDPFGKDYTSMYASNALGPTGICSQIEGNSGRIDHQNGRSGSEELEPRMKILTGRGIVTYSILEQA